MAIKENTTEIELVMMELEQAFYAGHTKACRKATLKALNAGIDSFDLISVALELFKYGILICYCFQQIEKKVKIKEEEKPQINHPNDVRLVNSMFKDILNTIVHTMKARATDHD